MKKSGLARGISVSLVAAAALLTTGSVQAQATGGSSLFPNGLSGAERNRMFMRLGYTHAFNKSKSGDVYDVTGPVATRAEINAAFNTLKAISSTSDPLFNGEVGFDDLAHSSNQYLLAQTGVMSYLNSNNVVAIGTPVGIKANVADAGTPTLSLGYWLDAGYKWTIEAFLLAVPLNVSAYGEGTNPRGKPNGVSGKEVITTKMLPPLGIVSYNFGGKDSLVRPYIGLGATYAVFFDTKATQAFERYAGGSTTVSLKNAFAIGPFAGIQTRLSDNWHLNLSVGQLKLKTTATMSTANTSIRSGDAVLYDYDPGLTAALTVTGEGAWDGSPDKGMTTAVMETIAKARTGNSNSLGTFVRKQDQSITTTILTVSVGYNF